MELRRGTVSEKSPFIYGIRLTQKHTPDQVRQSIIHVLDEWPDTAGAHLPTSGIGGVIHDYLSHLGLRRL
jgi:hypothetical protein